MLTAKEARTESEKIIKECATTQLCNIIDAIEAAVKDGKFSISESGYLNEETRRRLKDLGYQVYTGSQYNESYFSVSWK